MDLNQTLSSCSGHNSITYFCLLVDDSDPREADVDVGFSMLASRLPELGHGLSNQLTVAIVRNIFRTDILHERE